MPAEYCNMLNIFNLSQYSSWNNSTSKINSRIFQTNSNFFEVSDKKKFNFSVLFKILNENIIQVLMINK